MSAPSPPTVVVVPCFNEERRLDQAAFRSLATSGRVRLLFVDDGSTDRTGDILARMAEDSDAIEVFTLSANAGKAEAVRRGLLVALRGGATSVGYYDADLATPPHELLRLVQRLEDRPDLVGVFGSRVALLGSTIERSGVRHYLGRAYATVASMALGITVYDTQCGAKVFRVDDTVAAAVAEPFRSSWAFDVELLQRLLAGAAGAPGVGVHRFLEVPLETWRDVTGSKLRLVPAVRAFFDLLSLSRVHRVRAAPTAGAATGAAAAVMAPGKPARRAGDDERRTRPRRDAAGRGRA